MARPSFTSEMLIAEYIDTFDLDIAINRCGVLAGPWQMGKVDQGVVVLWLARHFLGVLSYIGFGGSGKQVRDLLHVADLADLVILQLLKIDQHRGQIYNVGGGLENSVSLQELTKTCQELSGNEIPVSSDLENRPGIFPGLSPTPAKSEKNRLEPSASTEGNLSRNTLLARGAPTNAAQHPQLSTFQTTTFMSNVLIITGSAGLIGSGVCTLLRSTRPRYCWYRQRHESAFFWTGGFNSFESDEVRATDPKLSSSKH